MRKSTIELTSLSLEQLSRIQAELPKVIAEKTEAKAQSLKSKLAKIAAEAGFGISLTPLEPRGPVVSVAVPAKAKTQARKTGSVPVKYRNTANPSETWSGRGRMARWMAEAVKKGARPEQFAVGA